MTLLAITAMATLTAQASETTDSMSSAVEKAVEIVKSTTAENEKKVAEAAKAEAEKKLKRKNKI